PMNGGLTGLGRPDSERDPFDWGFLAMTVRFIIGGGRRVLALTVIRMARFVVRESGRFWMPFPLPGIPTEKSIA
ncbi:MAG TPA: hypothetical protein VHO48_07255, partial [Anaerolineaceae bacterium]|nr:hypothetical protein [Anaerolineaceae bacterium]